MEEMKIDYHDHAHGNDITNLNKTENSTGMRLAQPPMQFTRSFPSALYSPESNTEHIAKTGMPKDVRDVSRKAKIATSFKGALRRLSDSTRSRGTRRESEPVRKVFAH